MWSLSFEELITRDGVRGILMYHETLLGVYPRSEPHLLAEERKSASSCVASRRGSWKGHRRVTIDSHEITLIPRFLDIIASCVNGI